MQPDEEAGILTQAKKDGITHMATGLAVIRDDKVLLVRRAAHDFLGGIYELPGGGVDDGETITAGAIRELKEETGLIVSNILGTFKGFDYSTEQKANVRQINFLVTVEPGDVVLDPNEHDDFLWMREAGLQELTVSPEIRGCLVTAFQVLKRHTSR